MNKYFLYYNFIYKIENGAVYFKTIDTWTWYRSTCKPHEIKINLKEIL